MPNRIINTSGKVRNLILKLQRNEIPDAQEYREVLLCHDRNAVSLLHEAAREASVRRFGNGIHIRGLVEITNICRNDCFYCGIRRSNGRVTRYRLTRSEILGCCRRGYASGFRTFVLQGGELPDSADRDIAGLCSAIRSEFPDCAVALSLGERSEEGYRMFREAGATRYLLRHETRDPVHYSRLHPPGMSLSNRLHCLDMLKDMGYMTGTGIMVGSPYQSIGNIVDDILYMARFRPEMIGIGPFIPHRDTPFAGARRAKAYSVAGGVEDACHVPLPEWDAGEMTLKLISIFRLMFPDAFIPATTALATFYPDGHERGILAGANVVMPNLSPPSVRDDYSLYDGKAAYGAESAEGLDELRIRLEDIGYRILLSEA